MSEHIRKQNVNYHLKKHTPMQEFFISGTTTFKSIEEFYETDLNEYLEMYWGEMVYQEKPSTNFIKVYKINDKYIFSDAILIDQFPHRKPIGSIVPMSISEETEIDHTGGTNSTFLYNLFNLGFHYEKVILDGIEEEIINGNFDVQDDMYCPDYLQSRNSSNDFLNGSPVPHADYISKKLWEITNNEYMYSSSNILKESTDRILRCNRTRKNHQLEPHSDCNQSSYLAAIHYSVPSNTEVIGREFEISIQDPIDEYERIHTVGSHEDQLYVKKKYDIKPLTRIPISNNLVIFINNYNPKFIHGHPPQISEEPVYSMVTQLANEQVAANNKLNYIKNISGFL